MYFQRKKINKYFLIFFIFYFCFNYNISKIYGIGCWPDCLSFCFQKKEDLPNFTQKEENICSDKLVAKYNDSQNNKKVVIYNYDYHLNLIEKEDIEKNKFYRYKYNEKNQIIFRFISNERIIVDQYDNFDIYEYNDRNQIINIRNKEGKIKFQYKYNDKGQKIQQIKFVSCKCGGLCIQRKIFNYKYNDLGQKIQKIYYADICYKPNACFKSYNTKTKNFVLFTYKYNDKGQRIQKTNHQNYNIYSYKYYNFDSMIY